jgi:hypothetical protein
MEHHEIAAAERRRIAQISAHPTASQFPHLTDVLCDSDVDAEAACRYLDAAAEGHAAALKADRSQRASAQARHITQPGLGIPDSTETSTNAAPGWSKALASANRAVDDVTGRGEGQPSGWGVAVRNANRGVN